MKIDLAITLDNQSDESLQKQLYRELRQAILTGRLLPHTRIPSTRSLAQSLGISRTTVTLCYECLMSEGYLETKVGSGTYVCAQLPDDLMHIEEQQVPPAQDYSTASLSGYGNRVAAMNVALSPTLEGTINFRFGRPALDEFPVSQWRRLLSRHCGLSHDWLDYELDQMGYWPLRQQISQYLSRSRAVQCRPEQIMVTNGSHQALDIILRVLIDSDIDRSQTSSKTKPRIGVEEPGYLSARRQFLSYGAELVPIPVDASGLIVESLHNQNPDPMKLIYVTPSHQFPTGSILSLPRRLALLAWVQAQGTLIIEDDYDSEYRYDQRPIPALQGLDRSGSVLYVGTFSKMLFPSLRIGYLVLPEQFVSLFSKAKWLCDRQLPSLEQRVLTEFIETGHLERHIRKMRSLYNRRRQALVSALQENFGDRAIVMGEKAGLHVMVKLKTSLSDEALIQRAADVGVGIISAQNQYLNPCGTGEFIFGYAELSESKIALGIQQLAKVIETRRCP